LGIFEIAKIQLFSLSATKKLIFLFYDKYRKFNCL
jgi:hypothetical protein